MKGHLVSTSLGFLLALAVGGVTAASLAAVGIGGAWPIVAGWLVFFGAATFVGRRLHHQRRCHTVYLQGGAMGVYAVCGNDYDATMDVLVGGAAVRDRV